MKYLDIMFLNHMILKIIANLRILKETKTNIIKEENLLDMN